MESDVRELYRIAAEAGLRQEPGYFERCLVERDEGKRLVLVAERAGEGVGCAQLIWQPVYPPFRKLGIPEIQDLNVVPAARRQGIGAALIDACEARARSVGKTEIGIGVGLYPAYGAAQRLYARKGYLPDGAGVCHDDVPVRAGEWRAVDDLLTLKMLKILI